MLRLCCDIRIQNEAGKVLYFDFATRVEVSRSWQELTNTARVTLPRRIKSLKEDMLPKLLQVGNPIVIKLGYDNEMVEEFRGFITSIGAHAPVELRCEDMMWKLKQTVIDKKSYRQVMLPELLKDIVPAGIEVETINVALGSFRISKSSVAKVLEYLKDTYGLQSYFRGDKLCSGFAYPPSWAGQKQYLGSFHFQKNIIDDGLAFQTRDEVRIKVEAISMLADNTTLKVTTGDEGGELHTLHFYDIRDKGVLKERAEQVMEKMRYDGYRGQFTTFGTPYIDHGYVVSLKDDLYSERSGSYFVDKVDVRWGDRGYRRELTIGPKTS